MVFKIFLGLQGLQKGKSLSPTGKELHPWPTRQPPSDQSWDDLFWMSQEALVLSSLEYPS